MESKNTNFTTVTVICPVTGGEKTLDNIEKEARKDVEWVVVTNNRHGFKFKIYKKDLAPANYEGANRAAAEFGCRLPDRIEFITLYNAIYTADLNDILLAIGGDTLKGWYWTYESDEDPQYNATNAWYVGMTSGLVNPNNRTTTYRVRPVSAL